MGLFTFLQSILSAGDPLLTNEDYCLSRLRHAIWGDWMYSYEIKTGFRPRGIFKNTKMSRKLCHADLVTCDCNDSREEDGSRIIPCQHIYRVALESGRLGELLVNPEIETMVKGMRDPLYNAFLSSIIERGYYGDSRKWSGSRKTFDELESLGILQGSPEEYSLTDFFRKNAAAFVYYSMTDLRRYSGRELSPGEYDPRRQCLRYEPED